MVTFRILIGSNLFLGPKIDKDEPLDALFKELKADTDGPAQILGTSRVDHCKFYRFERPIPARGKPDTIVGNCMDASDTWCLLERTDLVESLTDDENHLKSAYVCLVIELPGPNKERVITELRKRRYSVLFEALQIIVSNIGSWSKGDVLHNLKGGTLFHHGEPRAVNTLSDVESSLAEKRAYNVFWNPEDQSAQDFQIASTYRNYLDQYFVHTTTSSYVVKNTREFVAFFAVLRLYMEDAKKISEEPSSAFKANYVSLHYFVPPFFSCKPENSKTTFKADMPWKFPIMIATREQPSNWGKTKPKSDFSVISVDFLCPFLLCEVISERAETDRWRMLLQATAAARVGYCLTKAKSFFVAAIYVTKNLTAERYIVMQTDENGQVSIARKDYDLLKSEDAVDFLREMFNLQDKVKAATQDLDESKKNALKEIEQVARDLPSLSAQKSENKTRRTLASIPEDPEEHGGEAGRSPFTDDAEIVERLDEMGFEVDMVLFGFEHVAMISRRSDKFDRRFLKITNRAREVDVLEYLARIKAAENHTIPGVQVWTRSSGGFVIHTSSGGGHLTALREPNVHLWSAATQLVEGVAFMHKHGVAHRDIKPANVLIPPGGGRLSIIDFSTAVFVERPGTKSRGIVGTEEYMAPEVSIGGHYDAMRADAWSCGKTLEVLGRLCRLSPRSVFIMDLTRELMALNPLERPRMSEVLDRMVVFESSLSGCAQMRWNAASPCLEACS